MTTDLIGRFWICPDCNHAHMKWSARCTSCLSTSGLKQTTLPSQEASLDQVDEASPRLTIAPPPEAEGSVEELVERSDSGPVPISEIEEATFVRDLTNLPPLDHVLGGGLVVGSVVLLTAVPGSGKSSLTLQMLVGLQHRCLYVTGEETRAQLAATARRIGAVSNRLYVLAERDLDVILMHAKQIRAQTIAIDSIQKMISPELGGRAGSPAQLKECTARLVRFAKDESIATWIIGHVTGEGDVAGPKTLEHDVDVVLELTHGPKVKVEAVEESAEQSPLRILSCPSKNRFGKTGVSGKFLLTDKGLVPLDADGWNEEL